MIINKGEIWTVQWTGLAGKARPALVLQSAQYRNTNTDIMALITSFDSGDEFLRIPIKVGDRTGLKSDCFICIDKLMAIPIEKLGSKIGEASQDVMEIVNQRIRKMLEL